MNHIIKIIFTISLLSCSWNLCQAQIVWPGDVDNNGIVNNEDLLYIGIAYDFSGPPRGVSPDSMWQGYSFTEWGIQFSDTGLDYAYADCNGDGTINDLDFEVAINNFYLTHGTVSPNNYVPGVSGVHPELFFSPLSNLPVFEGGQIFFPISLGTPSQPATDFYGISFTIEFDSLVIDPFSAFFFPIDFTGGGGGTMTWISASGEPYLFGGNIPVIGTPGTLDVMVVKTDGTPIPEGSGVIGIVSAIIEENVVSLIAPGSNSVESLLQISNIRFINENLENTPIVNDTLEITILEYNTTLLSTTDVLSNEISLYPNPAQDRIYIQTPDLKVEQLTLVDQSGKVIVRKDVVFQGETIEISTSEIPSGFYFVKLLTNKGMAIKKVSIRRE